MSATSTGVYHRSYRADMALRATRIEYIRLALLAAAVVAAPYLVSAYWLHVLNDIGIAVIGAIGLNILVGYTGQISLGQAGFLAVGAYTPGISIHCRCRRLPESFWRTVSAELGAFWTAALRLKGLYLAPRARVTSITLGVIHWQFRAQASRS